MTTAEVTKNADGTYDFRLNNWMYGIGTYYYGIGTVEMKNLTATADGEETVINGTETMSILPGDDSSVSMWLASSLGEIPVTVVATFDGTNCKATVIADGSSTYFAQKWECWFNHSGTSGIESVNAASQGETYYDLQGIKLGAPEKGRICIVRHSDGTVSKRLVK